MIRSLLRRMTAEEREAERRVVGSVRHVLANCGPARSEVFTTKPVGAFWHIPLRASLEPALATDAERDRFARWAKSYPYSDGVAALLDLLLPRLGIALGLGDPPPMDDDTEEQRAVALLAWLRDGLGADGRLPVIRGYVKEVQAGTKGMVGGQGAVRWPPVARGADPALGAALALLAFTHFAPPLVLWRRTPTLGTLVSDRNLLVRDPHGAAGGEVRDGR